MRWTWESWPFLRGTWAFTRTIYSSVCPNYKLHCFFCGTRCTTNALIGCLTTLRISPPWSLALIRSFVSSWQFFFNYHILKFLMIIVSMRPCPSFKLVPAAWQFRFDLRGWVFRCPLPEGRRIITKYSVETSLHRSGLWWLRFCIFISRPNFAWAVGRSFWA